MASKTTKSAEILELSKTIKVNDKEYNINAVHSDVASQVAAPLRIKKYINAGDPDLTNFVGNQMADIDFVPASGGHYTGPIETPTHTSEKPITEQSVLNKAEIDNIICQLKGTSWFTWTSENGGYKFTAAVDENEVYQSICIVVGNNNAVQDFSSVNNSGNLGIYSDNAINQLPSYLYIGIVNDTNANIYFGTSDKLSPILLTNKLFDPNAADDNPIDASKIKEISVAIAAAIDRISKVERQADDNTTGLETLSDTCDGLQEADAALGARLATLEAHKKANTAADEKIKAKYDDTGLIIDKNYYRTLNKGDTTHWTHNELDSTKKAFIIDTGSKTNTILISNGNGLSPASADFSTQGELGDIWIVY